MGLKRRGKKLDFNRIHSGKHGQERHDPSLVGCCWSARYKFENWSWTLSMDKMNEAIVRVLGKHARQQSGGQTENGLPDAYLQEFVIVIKHSALSSSLQLSCKPRDNERTLANRLGVGATNVVTTGQ